MEQNPNRITNDELNSVSRTCDNTLLAVVAFRPLSWLLHHANREGRNKHFYKIKNRILSNYGTHICYDVQFIEGKKCFSCDGTGIYLKTSYQFGMLGINECQCWDCYAGWYKRPVWNILEKVKFGKYYFHQPFKKSYVKPEISVKNIEGYISHNQSKFGKLAITILFLVFERDYLKRYWLENCGWRCSWWLPRNYIHNFIYLIKYRSKSIPIKDFNRKISNFWGQKGSRKDYDFNEIPF